MSLDMMMMNMTMQMQETFYSDLHFEFLFDNLHVDNTAKYSGAMVVLFLLAIALSAMNFVVNHLSIQYRTCLTRSAKIAKFFTLGLFRFLTISTSYILMLAVMTYNTGVFIMVSSGLAIGYALTPEDKIAGKPNFYELSSQDTFFRGPNS